MNTKHSAGIPNQLCGDATPKVTTTHPHYTLEQVTNTGGSIQTLPKSREYSSWSTSQRGNFIFGPQKEQGQTSNQPQSPEQIQSTLRWKYSHSELANKG